MDRFSSLACLLAIGLAGCAKESRAPHMPLLKVEVVEAQMDSVPNRMGFVGYLASHYDAIIQPRVAGYLHSMHYQSGMPVRKGQLLFSIGAELLSTTMLAADAALQSAGAQAIEAQNNYRRAVPLARINAISQSQLDQYTAQHKAAEAAVRSAEQSLRNARLEVGYARLYSPIDGVAAYADAHVGDYVGPATQFSILTTVSNIDTMTVEVAIPMDEYLRSAGEHKSIYDNRGLLSDICLTLSDGSQYPHEGAYDYTRKDISNTTGTIVVVVMFPNPRLSLKQGQFARIEANIGPTQQHVVVPQQCVSQAQGVNSVWVVRADSTAEFRQVALGATYSGGWCIDSGIDRGEWIIASGQQKMHHGMKVIPIKM